MLEKKWIKILKDNVKTRKTLEHGSKKKISGTELDKTIQTFGVLAHEATHPRQTNSWGR